MFPLKSRISAVSKYMLVRQCSICEGKGAFQRIAPLCEVKRFIVECIVKLGGTVSNADIFADSLLEADYRGVFSHGINRLGFHIEDIQKELCDPTAVPKIDTESSSAAVVCGHNALGAVVGKYCMELAMEKALITGIALVVANNSNNFGMASWYTMQAMRKGFIGLSFSNSSPLMVPTNARDVVLGTNPMSIAAPGEDCDSMVLDIATTARSVGSIEIYKRRGKKLPKGWAVNKLGKPETDPGAVMKEPRLMPLGGKESHKGFGLALLVEILSGILADSSYGPKIRNWGTQSEVANIGHGFMAINPNKFAPNFSGRLSDLLCHIRTRKPADPRKAVLVPGDKERLHMEKVDKLGGILYLKNQRDALVKIAHNLCVTPIDYIVAR